MSGVDTPTRLLRLTSRPSFLAAAKGATCARGCVVVQRLARPDRADIAVGFTATKKIGGAVERNRAKRRMREAARQLLPLHGELGHNYVFVARAGLIARPWAQLLDDVKSALVSLAAGRADAPRPARSSSMRRRMIAPTSNSPAR